MSKVDFSILTHALVENGTTPEEFRTGQVPQVHPPHGTTAQRTQQRLSLRRKVH
jgi:hypothetical protein